MTFKSACVLVALAALTAVAGCTGAASGSGPDQVAESFWTAAAAGDGETAMRYVTEASAEHMSVQEDAAGGEFTLGTAVVDGERAEVPTTLVTHDNASQMKMDLTTVLVVENGDWKVDFDQTMMSMFGGAMGAMMEGLGDAMQQGMEQMGNAMAEGMEDMAQEMGEEFQDAGTADGGR